MKNFLKPIIFTLFAYFASSANAQIADGIIATAVEEPDSTAMVSVSDSLLMAHADEFDIFNQPLELPDIFFLPAVYDSYNFDEPLTIGQYTETKDWEKWIKDYERLSQRMQSMRHALFFQHPEVVQYSMATLPEPPAPYIAVIDPKDFTISVRESSIEAPKDAEIEVRPVKKKHWLRTFSASLQFSQAYVSPNWYQGGNNNLNALASIIYNVKLNQALHPNLLFETTAQYKLGMNSAPEDSIHSYNISEDILQVNSTFGLKAAKHWYYSLTGQFKTQVLNSYTVNTNDLVSAFLSPGELTAGLGMTYTYENPKKTFSINASIAPLSYHMITCINSRLNPHDFGIKEGRKIENQIGSSIDVNMKWMIAYNISLTSHLFSFSDYHSMQVDWENTLAFKINSFITTQIYAHLRYDTQTPPAADSKWKKLQLKEIFSIGFAYNFSSI